MKSEQLSYFAGFLAFLVPVNALSGTLDKQSGAVAELWWVPLAAALIGALSALVTPFVKTFLIQHIKDARSKTEKQHDIFRNYAAPLAAASEKLMWRFNEMFVDKRHHFLKSTTLPLVFNEYKRKSTLYRIACILGWIRAMHLELSALPRGASGFLTPISDAIAQVQSALADGPHVELHRLQQMCSIWRLSLEQIRVETRKSLAADFEVRLYGLGGDTLKHDSDHLKKLTVEQQLHICKELSRYLCSELQRAPLSDAIISETVSQAIAGLSYREALIYRDWQDAIGDAMLEPDPDSVRRFKIVGYQRFEEILEAQNLWMEVFRNSIVDIDLTMVDPNDFRAKQLRDLASGIARVLICLSESEEKDLIGQPILDVSRHLAQNPMDTRT